MRVELRTRPFRNRRGQTKPRTPFSEADFALAAVNRSLGELYRSRSRYEQLEPSKGKFMRSEKLQQWLKSQENIGGPEGHFDEMPSDIRKELLSEALCLKDLRDYYQSFAEGGTTRLERDVFILEFYVRRPQFSGPIQYEPPGKREENTVAPNMISTSSLFKARSKACVSQRPKMFDEKILSRADSEIKYTGWQLYQQDWDVLQALIDLSDSMFNGMCKVTPADVLRHIGMPISGYSYDWLKASLERLMYGTLSMLKKEEGKPYRRLAMATHILDYMIWNRGETITYCINPLFGRLTGYGYGLVDWNKRKALGKSELSKKLQVVFSASSDNRQFHSIPKLLEFSGYSMALAQFMTHLKKALNTMIKVGVIHSYWISKPKRGESDKKVLCVWVKEAPDETSPVPTDRQGRYFDEIILRKEDRESVVDVSEFRLCG